jgi:hypothetical protein
MRESGPVRIARESARVFPRRPFTVLDELILIIPLAVAIVVTVAFLSHENPLSAYRGQASIWLVLDWVPVVLLGLVPRYAALGMVALLVLRLRRPRPGWRRLSRQPGAVACAAATAALLAGGVLVLSRYMSMANPIGSNPVNIPLVHMPNELAWGPHDWPILESRIPPAVVSAWFVLALCGRWRAEPSWMDRTGRVFGSFWVGLWMFRWYLVVWS